MRNYISELRGVMLNVSGVRRMGAASLDLAYVAAGRFDAYWEANLSPWDMAAGIVLVREAGGTVSDIDGRDDMLAERRHHRRQRNDARATLQGAEADPPGRLGTLPG